MCLQQLLSTKCGPVRLRLHTSCRRRQLCLCRWGCASQPGLAFMPSHSCFQIQTRPQVQDHSSLLDSLVSLLSPEELVGDNQYDCANCRGKRDATRRMMLRRLPPFLSLSLQRFVFDQRVCRRMSVVLACMQVVPGSTDV